MDWFERITGFRELGYAQTREGLQVDPNSFGPMIVSRADGSRRAAGRLEMPTLAELRRHVALDPPAGRSTRVGCIAGDARALHAFPEMRGALVQVASQFNLLEMVAPHVTPEYGLRGYEGDHTQGPACAIAAGAATIWRNYLVPVGDGHGQTADRQLDALAPLGAELSRRLELPVGALWDMRNGYALCRREGLAAIAALLRGIDRADREKLKGHLSIGLHVDVEVTDVDPPGTQRLSQALCSALPVRYSSIEAAAWEPFARLVLEAAYEATLLAACRLRGAGGSGVVLLTRLGGGAFGNHDDWIDDAIEFALETVAGQGLDLRLVSRGAMHPSLLRIEQRWREKPVVHSRPWIRSAPPSP